MIPEESNYCPFCGAAQLRQHNSEPFVPALLKQPGTVSNTNVPNEDSIPSGFPPVQLDLPHVNQKDSLYTMGWRAKKKVFGYLVACIVGIGLYFASMFIGSFVNVLITRAVGFRSFSAFSQNAETIYLLLVLAFSLVNHIFFGWLTSEILYRYGVNNGCLNLKLFDIAAGLVLILGVTIFPLLNINPGWLTYLSHAIATYQFGKAKIKRGQSVSAS